MRVPSSMILSYLEYYGIIRCPVHRVGQGFFRGMSAAPITGDVGASRPDEERRTMAVLVLGTRNPKKRVELLEILADQGIELRDLTSYPQAPEVEEDGATFQDNARKKAVVLAKALGEWVLGE